MILMHFSEVTVQPLKSLAPDSFNEKLCVTYIATDDPDSQFDVTSVIVLKYLNLFYRLKCLQQNKFMCNFLHCEIIRKTSQN